jgi:hypothetical protein
MDLSPTGGLPAGRQGVAERIVCYTETRITARPGVDLSNLILPVTLDL